MATEKVTIPDFGDVQEITVVDVYVSPGDKVEVEDPLIALESEKAVMDIPSTAAGIVKEVYLKEEDEVGSGDAIVLLETSEEESSEEESAGEESAGKEEKPRQQKEETEKEVQPQKAEKKETAGEKTEKHQKPDEQEQQPEEAEPGEYHATPSVRAYAREQDVELANLTGTGPKGRILKEDVDKFQKGGRKKATAEIPSDTFQPKPLEDFSKYGETEEIALGRIKKISGPQLLRSWVTIPHVTHFDEADVTDLEAFRQRMNAESEEEGMRYSALVFIIKAVVATLKAFPAVNSSLVPGGASLIYKYFYNIGIAVDTPDGLMVPVIRNAEKKGIREIAAELKKLSGAAREGKLGIPDMQGASFTISSLGGIGGTGFAPIVNAPQVAILGLSRNYKKPVWHEEQQVFRPRLTLPFSLSYDHRVIDGAEAARFCRALSRSIEDLRRAL
ncbi:2-oxo acid dehydrogenase subunit E2 [Desulfopila inferna]|uniref:2-oxo acid dehydrogenase subunit E2 n=1 Tax=Desulfopila inferna TaxID=468528 RepID=UPI00196297B9|nr:2-oxo acid dehydrogenase subunit E2 [Desulfopila inferna]MBM9603563.1 2-oxo acid dehydrogenase subunit E2 [Desulfopila inferna]